MLYNLYKDILHHYLSGYLEDLPDNVRESFSHRKFHKRVIKSIYFLTKKFYFLIIYLISGKKEETELKKHLSGKVWVFVNSLNSFRAIGFIGESREPYVIVTTDYFKLDENNRSYRLSVNRQGLYFMKIIPVIILFLFRQFKQTIRYFDLISQSVGLFETYSHLLRVYKPRAIIFSNDHVLQPRSLFLAAKMKSIPTIYLQHASVNERLPPLRFDLALLEGQDALDKYSQQSKISSMVKFIGMPKFDEYVSYRNSNKVVKNVGVCTTRLDMTECIQTLIKFLISNFSELNISFRKHPADPRTFLFDDKEKVYISNAKEESTFDFLRRQDLIIASNSSIHLEACLLNVVSVYYNLDKNDKQADYYGYLKNGLISEATDFDKLSECIRSNMNNKENVYPKAKYYNHLVGTDMEGDSKSLATKYISEFLNMRNGQA